MLRTIYVYTAGILYLIMTFLIQLPIVLFVYYFVSKEKGIKVARKYAKKWGKNLIGSTGCEVEVIMKDKNLKEKIENETIVVVSNHQSNFDIPLLLEYFPKDIGFVAKKEMEHWPILGAWMKMIQCVFLDRSNPREGIKSIKEAVKKIKTGYSIVIFPEGTRSKTGEIMEFKKGSFKLATDSKVKLIPVTIKGTNNIQVKGSMKIQKAKVKIIIDNPIDVKELDRTELKELNVKVKDIIEKNYRGN
ncbi:lysophospholipid acyltransferase family protein [Haliovirga abyssi]|uniref:1-acyl-sn-glycerol-3-phosphate acyltransferase n=1 Tax=Haliovirga abyssi TaxID=2996794 RepID=A0AAU9DRE7_9FUSO|nr:lysophospholipid acyltransferase family protein [Haliovirga abyssi]BDU49509.1 1-acyl-sn-glycerol-3-phosphate acyltransferase [Haliovirga abyssi]